MRLEEIRGERVPGLGSLRLRPGEGLVGWTGGDSRHRRRFSDFLHRALGLPRELRRSREEGEGARSELRAEGEVRVEIAGRSLLLREPGSGPLGDAGQPGSLARALGVDGSDLALVWGGAPEEDAGPLLDAGARLLAGLHGVDLLEGGLEWLAGAPRSRANDEGVPPDRGARLRAELREVRRGLRELEEVPERTVSLEEELRSLRADAAEVTGDLEVGTMDWLRERQDAETHLQAYRDRARELRARVRELEEAGPRGPCPFCARPLGDHYSEVLRELREEWESIVQDGRWWRRRWEQLELKPDRLQELEGRSLRLQAAVEECAERLERCRFELRERDELREREGEILAALGKEGGTTEDGGSATAREPLRESLRAALEGVRDELLSEARTRLVRGAGSYLNRISGGRLLGLLPDGEGGVVAMEDGRRLDAPTEEDRAAIRVALRLALADRAVAEGLRTGSILVEEPFDRMDLQARLRAVEVLRGMRERIPQIFLVVGDEVAEAAPERFEAILELREEPSGRGGGLRRVPGGVGRLRL